MINNFLTSLLGLNIYVYGFGIAVSLIIFLFLFWRGLRKTALNEEKMIDSLFSSSIVSLVFGRLFYVIFNSALFEGSFLKPFLIISYPGINEFFFWVFFFLYWFIYGSRKKISFALLNRLLLLPIVVSKLLLSIFSLVKESTIENFLMIGLLLFLIGLYFLLVKILKKEIIKQHSISWLFLYLSIPNFVVDFFKKGRVYFLELNIISYNQLSYLVVIVVIFALLLTSTLRKEKK